MSDADDQLGGRGGSTGRDPRQEDDDVPDPVSGNEDGDVEDLSGG